jgi:hypothetical protein
MDAITAVIPNMIEEMTVAAAAFTGGGGTHKNRDGTIFFEELDGVGFVVDVVGVTEVVAFGVGVGEETDEPKQYTLSELM